MIENDILQVQGRQMVFSSPHAFEDRTNLEGAVFSFNNIQIAFSFFVNYYFYFIFSSISLSFNQIILISRCYYVFLFWQMSSGEANPAYMYAFFFHSLSSGYPFSLLISFLFYSPHLIFVVSAGK
uniref:Uncharacterized protein n=1 Tax=Micrurus spixii TaxID=129469 RepID=A0A2D4M4G7_9SAUR